MGKFCVSLHPHLFQNASAVGADSAITKRQDAGNLTNCVARGNQTKHLELAIRKRLMRWAARAPFEIEDEVFGDGWADISSPAHDFVPRRPTPPADCPW